MEGNIFSQGGGAAAVLPNNAPEALRQERGMLIVPDYTKSDTNAADHIAAVIKGFVIGFVIMYVFYQILILSILGGAAMGFVNIFAENRKAKEKRIVKLRSQFFDLLESMSVSMRAGNPVLKAIESARSDLALVYTEDSDIVTEVDIIINKFNSAVSLADAFSDLAERSGIEDINDFASVYATIEGKSSRADEIIMQTKQIISDKMAIEMEIETMMMGAKNEVNIMLVMPLIVLIAIALAGGGFMDAIYTTALGRIVATAGLIMYIISYILAKKLSSVEI